jgi:hypothetical protein
MPRGLFLALRFSALAFFFLTSIYCLMSYTPFTYTHVIQAGLLPWLSPFARMHRWLFWAAEGAVLATLVTDLRGRRIVTLVYAVAAMAAGAALSIHPVLPGLGNDAKSFVWGEVSLLGPLALAIVDHLVAGREVRWGSTSTREDASIAMASAISLLLAFVVYAATFHVRARAGLGLSGPETATGLLWSLLLHASFIGAAFVVWCLTRALASWVGGARAWPEYALVAVALAVLFSLLVRNFAFAAMSFRGSTATAAAATWGIVLIASVSGLALVRAARRQRADPRQARHGRAVVRFPLRARGLGGQARDDGRALRVHAAEHELPP